jgi:uncharacterized protein YbaP (TraB family)
MNPPMTFRHRLRRVTAALAALLVAQPAYADPQTLPTPVAPSLREVPAPALSPALWRVADADTTIYLFGTIHALRPGVNWFGGPVEKAFGQSDTLVTEIADVGGLDVAQTLLGSAMLPAGQTLRGRLSKEDRAAYEAALERASIPAAALDRFKPWYAAVVLSSLPLLRAGYKLEEGVEIQLAARAKTAGKKQEGLETAAYQLGLFDALPEASQLSYLRQVVGNLDKVTEQIDGIIAEWSQGDATALAKAMNAEESDAGLAEALITRRNKAWAQWLKQRLDKPGTVFFAVGAGHLAGPGSVQDQLTAIGIKSERLQ